jgi:hypothetical protein
MKQTCCVTMAMEELFCKYKEVTSEGKHDLKQNF